ncbi:MAG: gephyrin-like molybdotransferase Glp [Pseudomonadota bacterium]
MSDACAQPGLLTVAEARARLVGAAPLPVRTDYVSLAAAHGRVLAAPQRALVDVPPAENSAMDGYALRIADLRAAAGSLPVSQRIPAGSVPAPLQPGSAARIFTGAPLPAGADAVLMQEDCREQDGLLQADAAAVAALRPGVNIRVRGEDIVAGREVLAAGTRLGPAQLGVLAAAGIAAVPVYAPLRVAFFSTGDELLEPGEEPQPGRIYNSNRYALRACLERADCVAIDLGVVVDDRAATIAALRAAAARADLVITTGGASVGEEDHLRAALLACGAVDLWKVAIKPGKPLLFGRVDDARGPVPLLGLPGNPVSVAVTFLVLALPLLRAMQGMPGWQPLSFRLPAAFAVQRPAGREEYLRVRLVAGTNGPCLERHPNQGSGVLTSMAWADGLARVPAGSTLAAGDPVEFLPFSSLLG